MRQNVRNQVRKLTGQNKRIQLLKTKGLFKDNPSQKTFKTKRPKSLKD